MLQSGENQAGIIRVLNAYHTTVREFLVKFQEIHSVLDREICTAKEIYRKERLNFILNVKEGKIYPYQII